MKDQGQRCRPAVEALEERLLLTTTRLIIDFTPDTTVRNKYVGFHRRNFADAFRGHTVADAPFLDFDGNGVIDTRRDPAIAAALITGRVMFYFARFLPLGVSVRGVDVLRQTQRGAAELRNGLHSPRLQVFVMYVGGFINDPSTVGESFQAAVGFNNEDYARVYADAIVLFFQQHLGPGMRPIDFANFVASTVAHEFGHMLGLGHPIPDFHDHTNVMDSSGDGQNDSFPDRFYPADLVQGNVAGTSPGVQNPTQELFLSFLGQPNENDITSDLISHGKTASAAATRAARARDELFAAWERMEWDAAGANPLV